MTVPLPPVDQPPNCAMFQPSGSSNRSANSNNNRRLTRGLGTSHFSSIAFLSLFFGLVPRLLCGRSTDRVSGRHVAHNFFFFFPFLFHCKSPALGGALWGGPPFIFFKILLILQDEDNITVLFRNECDQIRPKLAVNEGTATNIHLAAKLTTTETWKFHQSIADMMRNRLEQNSIKSDEKRPR